MMQKRMKGGGIEEGGSHNFVKIGDITYGRPLKLLGREEVED